MNQDDFLSDLVTIGCDNHDELFQEWFEENSGESYQEWLKCRETRLNQERPIMAGRIETYVHSDNATRNKAAAMVRVSCQTDFGARTPSFIDFCTKVARYACGFQIENPTSLLAITTEAGLQTKLEALQAEIGETVTIEEIRVMTLAAEETQAEKRIQPTGKYAELAKKRRENGCLVPGCTGTKQNVSGAICDKCGHDHEV